MKKLLLALAVGLTAVSLVQAGRRSYGPRRARRSCAPRCRPKNCEEAPPKCCKTVMVDKTIQVCETVEVAAKKVPMYRWECSDECEKH